MFKVLFYQKLKSKKGESLAEVMIAVLIIAIGLVLLSSLIIASSKMVDNSGKRLSKMYNVSNNAEEKSGSYSNMQVDINSEKTVSGSLAIMQVKLYESNNGDIKIMSYEQ